MASTAIGGGVIGALGFGLSALCLPKNQPTELKGIEGKGVTIDKDKNIVEHNGYTYKMMKKEDGHYVVERGPLVVIEQSSYTQATMDVDGKKKNVLVDTGLIGNIENEGGEELLNAIKTQGNGNLSLIYPQGVTDDFIDGLQLRQGGEYHVCIYDDNIILQNASDKKIPALIFDIQKDSDGAKKLVISKDLQAIIDEKHPTITEDKMKAIVNGDFATNFKIFDAHEKLASLKNPEPIENLIQGAGRKWGVIAAITAGAIAVGAGIGYLLSHKNSQQQSSTKGAL